MESSSPEPAPSPPPVATGKRRRRFVLIALGVVLLIAAMALAVLNPWSPWESTDDAFLEGRITQLAPQVSGRVLRVLVDDNAPVSAGQLLVLIDDRDLKKTRDQAAAALGVAEAGHAAASSRLDVTRARAEASVREARAEVARARAREDQARAEVVAARALSARAAADLARYELLDPKSISRQRLDLARRTAEESRAQLDAARTRVTASEADVAAARERLKSAEAAPFEVAEREAELRESAAGLERARALLAEAELRLSYVRVTAPVGGRATRKNVEVGNYVVSGQALMALVEPELWTVANFKETQLVRMAPGQAARISIDARGGRTFAGRVDSIQAGSGARFSLFPPENATGNFVKVVQRVPVKIVFERPEELSGLPLGPGMSVEAEVRVK